MKVMYFLYPFHKTLFLCGLDTYDIRFIPTTRGNAKKYLWIPPFFTEILIIY